MNVLCEDLKQPLLDADTKKKRKDALIIYMKANLNFQSFYFYRFFFCELLNLVIAIGQIYLTDLFLDGEFLNYGIDVMSNEETQPMTRIFPKMTKCTFHKYGPSGSVQKYDGLCVLPVNVLNEKIYIFLWFWFGLVCILSIVAIIYHALIIFSSNLRKLLIQARARVTPRHDIEYILLRFDIGDWFLFYQLSKNVDPFTFKEICHELSFALYSNNYN